MESSQMLLYWGSLGGFPLTTTPDATFYGVGGQPDFRLKQERPDFRVEDKPDYRVEE